MEVLGGVWTVQILWFLSAGPRRFSELKSDLGTISSKVLTARLKRLVAQGVLDRIVVDSSPPTVEYGLTSKGHLLVPAVREIFSAGERLRDLS